MHLNGKPQNHNSCGACSKKLVKHKIFPICFTCSNKFHHACVELTPSDVKLLISTNLLQTWICKYCSLSIFPKYDEGHCKNEKINSTKLTATTREICKTCKKLGNRLLQCDLCSENSHARCFAGQLGCKSCLREIYPGYDINPRDLFDYKNNALFNPYNFDLDINYVGNDGNEIDHGYLPWSKCSDLLNNCNYYEFSEVQKSRNYELKILSLNIRSLKDKISNLNENSDEYAKFDVLCFNETNCDPQNFTFGVSELTLNGFHPPFIQTPARASNKGGGLAIYVNKNLTTEINCKVLSELSSNTDPNKGEFLFLEIKTKYKTIIVCNMYRSPSGDVNSFISELDSRLQALQSRRNKMVIFVSDSNIDLLKFGHVESATKLVNLFSENGFAPTISRPTRVTSHTNTLIDHIFLNNCAAVTKSGVITESLSDHMAVFVNVILDQNKIDCKLSGQEDPSYNQNQINDENLTKFKRDIQNTDWDFLLSVDCADEKFNLFESKYREIYDKNFPKKTKKLKRRKCNKPWILPWLESACDRKNKLYKTYIKNPTSDNETKYKKMKCFVAKHIDKAKKKFYENYFRRYSDDGRKQWDMINQLLNRKTKGKTKISKLYYNDQWITNSQQIADTFNEFFCNIAHKLKDEHTNTNLFGRPPEATLGTMRRNLTSMNVNDCTTYEIENIIKELKNKATSDISTVPLKLVGDIISPVIQHITSASMKQGIFPTKLKCAKVIPLHKGGSTTEITNYRPISLLSCFSKIYEKLMQVRLTQFLKVNNLLYKSQYGFRSGHCCDHALLEAQCKLNDALQKKQIAVLLLLDFSKAFDMVDHDILLRKLEHYGIRGICLDWFSSYLTNRQQYVHVNNHSSNKLSLRYSVPQGSVLGPILFLLYINDLPEVSKLANFVFFADDANIIITADNYIELSEKVNTVLTLVQSWVKNNGLKLNIAKTKYMIFTNKTKQEITISLDGQRITESSCERFLGVMIDSRLTWSQHINLLATKISRNAGILYKLKNFVPDSVLKMIYNSFIQSHMNYCSSVWGLGSNNSISKLFIAQKKAIRAIENKFNVFFYDKTTGNTPCHTKSIFNRNKVLTIHNLITKNCLMQLHKVYLNVTPTSISSLFKIINLNQPRRDPLFFEIPYSRLKSSDNLITHKGPKMYNKIANSYNNNLSNEELPLQRKFANSFKASLNSYLLKIQCLGDETWNSENFALLQ